MDLMVGKGLSDMAKLCQRTISISWRMGQGDRGRNRIRRAEDVERKWNWGSDVGEFVAFESFAPGQ